MPADNGRFCESWGVNSPELLCEFASVVPVRAVVNPRPRKAAGTLCASGRERGGKSCKNRENSNVTHDFKDKFCLIFKL